MKSCRGLWLLLALLLTFVVPREARAHTAFARFFDDWRYDASGTDLGTAWRDPGFDDSAWLVGETPIGQGGGANFQTQIPLTQQTTYLRHAFDVEVDPASVVALRLNLAYAHGFVVYLNGQEVERRNLPIGPIDFSTPAQQHVIDPDNPFDAIDLSAAAALLVSGTNVVAVELHQTSPADPFLLWAPEILFETSLEHVTRAPYLQIATPDELTIRWRTSVPTDSVVAFGAAPEALSENASDATPTTEHVVQLTGLTPDTSYFYAIGSSNGPLEGADAGHVFKTAPAVGSPASTRIWVLGDAGSRTSRQRTVRDAYQSFTGARGTDLVMMLGDNAYGEGRDEQYQFAVFEDMYEATLRSAPLWPAIGNHDWQDGTDVDYLDIFSLPTRGQAGGVASGSQRYYAFDYANVHFVCLDTTTIDLAVSTEEDRDAMIAWLEDDLASTTQQWLVAFFHHPPYTAGSHESDFDGLLDETRQRLLPLLEDAGVDLVLTGHSHVYERSILLDGHYGPSPEFIADPAMFTVDGGDGRETGDGAYVKPAVRGPHQGTVYVVNGNSGGRGDGGEWPLDFPTMVELYDPHVDRTARGVVSAGSLVLDLDDQRLDASYVDFDSGVLDSFTILKRGPGEGGAGGGDEGGGEPIGGQASAGGAGGTGGQGADGPAEDDGCSCRASGAPSPGGGALLLLSLLAAGIVRRRAA